MHHISYFFMAFGTHKLFYKALQVTALTTLKLTNPLLLLKSITPAQKPLLRFTHSKWQFFKDAGTDYYLYLFKSTMTTKDNVIKETDFQLIQSWVSKEGYHCQ